MGFQCILEYLKEKLVIRGDAKLILITDIDSTTTKALLIHDDKGKLHFADALDVPTTVEKPNGEVKIGVLDAVKGLQAQTGINIPCPRIAGLGWRLQRLRPKGGDSC